MTETGGQRGLVRLVDQCLRPAKTERLRPLPIILLWGPRAGGKSELLDHIQERFFADRPCVRANRHELAALRPHEVALRLASRLGHRVDGFGRLQFPRLFLGVTAIRGPVNMGNPAETRPMIIKRTIPNRRERRRWARDTAVALAGVAGADPATQGFLGLAVEGMGSLAETALALNGRGMKWYQDGLIHHFADPVDALVSLADQEADPRQRRAVDEALCRAFLADLRDEYAQRALQVYERNENCLALLDDADSAGASVFLDIVAAQRREWDPLLIVAAASTRSPSAGDAHPERWVVHDAAEVSYQAWSAGRVANNGRSALYPVGLGGLSLGEAQEQFTGDAGPPTGEDAAIAGVLGNSEKSFKFAHRLTDGHLGGMRLVLRAMSLRRQVLGESRKRTAAVAPSGDVRAVFGWPTDADNGATVAEEVRRLLVGGWPVEIHGALMRGAAVRDFGEDAMVAVLKAEPQSVAHMIREFRSRDSWVRYSPDADDDNMDSPTLHPFTRRALVQLLANPTGPGESHWDEVHEQLRSHWEKRDQRDLINVMYHRLALGEVSEVAEYLTTLFENEEVSTRKWYADLSAVTQAPLADPARAADSQQHWELLVEDAEGRHTVTAELIAALQLHTDPLADPDHQLCLMIAQELERLAPLSKAFFFMLERAKEFRDCWEQWRQ